MTLFQDIFKLLTPGGGGYGPVASKSAAQNATLDDGPPAKRKPTDVFHERGSLLNYKLGQESV